jgi:hypothetical protein
LFENAALLKEILTWGRESSRQVQDLKIVQTNVLTKEECILKNKNKFYPFKKLCVFYNSCLKTFASHLVLYMLTNKRDRWKAAVAKLVGVCR